MTIAQSKLTAQGQISVPVEVRRKLGVGPGSILEWEAQGDQVVVRRAGRHSSEDIHKALFPKGAPKAASTGDMKAGVRRLVRRRHARG
ncbi:MAG TPA: AbrB/MazE/SpoVT family DNA-binding domain-containing protein [Burkholderiales bacterium]